MLDRFHNMPLDWNALLNDEKVAAMSDCAFRAYLHLLRAAWHSDVPASLPNNDNFLARASGLGLEAWQHVKAEIQGCFRVTGSRWQQKRMRQVYDAMVMQRKRNVDRTANASRARRRHRNDQRNDDVTTSNSNSRGIQSPQSPPGGGASRGADHGDLTAGFIRREQNRTLPREIDSLRPDWGRWVEHLASRIHRGRLPSLQMLDAHVEIVRALGADDGRRAITHAIEMGWTKPQMPTGPDPAATVRQREQEDEAIRRRAV